MALQTKSRITKRTVDRLACELHEQLLNHPNNSEIDHVFAALIPKGINPADPEVLRDISPTEPVLLHKSSDGGPTQVFDEKWDFLAFSIHGDPLEQLQDMHLPKGTGLLAVNMLVKADCHARSHEARSHQCTEEIHRLSIVISKRHSAGVVSDSRNPPMFYEQNGGMIVEAMQRTLSRSSNR